MQPLPRYARQIRITQGLKALHDTDCTMTAYELTISIDKDTRTRLAAAGILWRSIERDMHIYERFIALRGEGRSKRDCYMAIGEKTFTSAENVRKIVEKMQKEVK